MPPYLAGRIVERERFTRLLDQTTITDNLIITGLRGVGKSVLLESFRPIARQAGWLWTGDDFTESVSLSEASVGERLLTDLSLTLGPIFMRTQMALPMGFATKTEKVERPLQYDDLRKIYDDAPGLSTDKLKSVLRHVGALVHGTGIKGIIFAYDEAQNLSDQADTQQYPLSVLLDVFQSLQRSPGGLPFMLILTGLPTLFPKLNETRTYTERMFDLFTLDKLSPEESRLAILKPIEQDRCPVTFMPWAVDQIVEMSGGYPYFIQFICKEFFDVVIAKLGAGQVPSVPKTDIIRKLDQRFFSGRWDNASDRQREFMMVAALIPGNRKEFTVAEIVQTSRDVLGTKQKAFSTASAGMMLKTLTNLGFTFRNRRGKYSFTVPLLDEFIIRQMGVAANLPAPFAGPSGP
jgi:hypothetical protein